MRGINVLCLLCCISCQSNNNSIIDSQLTYEFATAIAAASAVSFTYQYDGLTPQESYFVNDQLVFLKFSHAPEVGFVEGKVVFDRKTGTIDQYTLRVVKPDWKNYSHKSTGTDTDSIYIIYPTLNQTFTYANNNCIDSTYRPDIYYEDTAFIYRMKAATEAAFNKQYNTRSSITIQPSFNTITSYNQRNYNTDPYERYNYQ